MKGDSDQNSLPLAGNGLLTRPNVTLIVNGDLYSWQARVKWPRYAICTVPGGFSGKSLNRREEASDNEVFGNRGPFE